MRGITRENARPGVDAIRSQSRESRYPESGRRITIRLLDTDKVDEMGRKKLKQFGDPGLETASILLKNPKGFRGNRKQEA